MIGPLTYLDAALIAVAFISGLLAMYRGLSRELLSIVSWAIAGGAVLYFIFNQQQIAQDMAQQMGTKVQIAQIAIGAIIFLVVLIIVHLLTTRLSDAILDSSVGMIDRLLGFVFGIFRGFLLIVIPFMFADWFLFNSHYLQNKQTPATDIPAWVDQAKSRDAIVGTGRSITALLQQYLPSSLTESEITDPEQAIDPNL
jgi:membrane protein required for colicin V production